MITMSLIGGLGNQMFQYAAGKALAERHGVPLALDISGFRNYALRPFLLCRLGQGASGGGCGRGIRQHVDNLLGFAHGYAPFAVTLPVAPAPEAQARSTDWRPQCAR